MDNDTLWAADARLDRCGVLNRSGAMKVDHERARNRVHEGVGVTPELALKGSGRDTRRR